MDECGRILENYSDKKLSQYYFVHHKSYMHWCDTERRALQKPHEP